MKRTRLIELNDRAVRQFGMFGIQGGKRNSFVLQVFTQHTGKGPWDWGGATLSLSTRVRALICPVTEDRAIVSRIVR